MKPLVEAVEKLKWMWEQEDRISLLTDGISLPGVTLKSLFSSLSPSFRRDGESDVEFVERMTALFSLIAHRDADFYSCLRKNIVGGPSIVFCRYADAFENVLLPEEHPERHLGTRIRNGLERVVKILGLDVNSLYPWAMSQPMPSGAYVRWLPVDKKGDTVDFENDPEAVPFEFYCSRPHFSQAALEWLEWQSHLLGRKLQHQGNGHEKRIGTTGFPVDGWDCVCRRAYQFHGCHWHCCPICRPHRDKIRKPGVKTFKELFETTKRISNYLKFVLDGELMEI